MAALMIVGGIVVTVMLIGEMSLRTVQEYEEALLSRLRRIAVKRPGLARIVWVIDGLRRVSMRTVALPIDSLRITTRDDVSIEVSAVAYYRVVDATKASIANQSATAAIDQITRTTLRDVVCQHTLDETLDETGRINVDIRAILDTQTEDLGVLVTEFALTQAIDSRLAIEQAKGIIAERARVDTDEALSQLQTFAHNTNRDLTEVASDLVSGNTDIEPVVARRPSPNPRRSRATRLGARTHASHHAR